MGGVEKNVFGVTIRPLKIISDERGSVLHMLRSDSPEFSKFGEVYFSEVKSNVIKAWKRHLKMVQNFAVPVGAIKLVIYDDQPNSLTYGTLQEIVTGVQCGHYELVQVPPMVWYGFMGLGESSSLIANCTTLTHNIEEVERLPLNNSLIPYSWCGA